MFVDGRAFVQPQSGLDVGNKPAVLFFGSAEGKLIATPMAEAPNRDD
jgi:hypothetical protein